MRSVLTGPPLLAAASGSGTAAIIVFALMPVLVGAMAEKFGLNELQSGLVATAYFSTYALVALSSPLWIRRWNWRRVGLAGFIFMLLALSVALNTQSFQATQMAIAAVGVGGGLLFPISLTLASDMENTERVYAIKLAVEQLVPAALLIMLSLGWLISSELSNIVMAIIVIVVLCLAASIAMPSAGRAQKTQRSSGAKVGIGVLALTALAISFAGFAGLWVFLERLGSQSGFEAGFIGLWLAVGLVSSGAGPLLAAVVADKVAPVRAIICSIVPALMVIALLSGQPGELAFAAALALLPLAYYFSMSYMMSLVAAADSNGKIAGLMSFALAVGAASGPAIYGALKDIDGPALTAMAGLIALGTLLMIIVARKIPDNTQEITS